jgi:hypothetical protein
VKEQNRLAVSVAILVIGDVMTVSQPHDARRFPPAHDLDPTPNLLKRAARQPKIRIKSKIRSGGLREARMRTPGVPHSY